MLLCLQQSLQPHTRGVELAVEGQGLGGPQATGVTAPGLSLASDGLQDFLYLIFRFET